MMLLLLERSVFVNVVDDKMRIYIRWLYTVNEKVLKLMERNHGYASLHHYGTWR